LSYISQLTLCILDFLESRLNTAENDLNSKMKVCLENGDKNILSFDEKKIKTFNLNREEFYSILQYFNYKNSEDCYAKEHHTYLNAALKLVKAKMVYRFNYEKTLVKKITIFTNLPEAEKYNMMYYKLPTETKKYFEKIIGTKPFYLDMGLIEKLYPDSK